MLSSTPACTKVRLLLNIPRLVEINMTYVKTWVGAPQSFIVFDLNSICLPKNKAIKAKREWRGG